jgi:hypothetical protein
MEQQEQKAKAPAQKSSQKPSRPAQKKPTLKKKPAVQVKETDKTETAVNDEILVVKAPKDPESMTKATKAKVGEPQSTTQNLYVLAIQNKKDNVSDTYVSATSFNEAIAKFYASEHYRKNNKSSILSIAQVNTFFTNFIA